MPTTRGPRNLVVPIATDAADIPAAFEGLTDSIDAYLNGNVDIGGHATAVDQVSVSGSGPQSVDLRHASAGVDLKRSRLENDTGKTRLQSVNDAYTTTKTGLVLDHATGVVDHPNGFTGRRVDSPYFRAYRSTAASYANTATVIFNTETDPNGWYDPATGIFLPLVAGTYRISWGVSFAAVIAAGQNMTARATHSGGQIAQGSVGVGGTSLTIPPTSVGAVLLPFNGSTDSLTIKLYHNIGGSVALDVASYSTHFEAEYVGA